ncbi:hypothetical protein ACLOJK_040901 [Asimina triloba]
MANLNGFDPTIDHQKDNPDHLSKPHPVIHSSKARRTRHGRQQAPGSNDLGCPSRIRCRPDSAAVDDRSCQPPPSSPPSTPVAAARAHSCTAHPQ